MSDADSFGFGLNWWIISFGANRTIISNDSIHLYVKITQKTYPKFQSKRKTREPS